jgi:flavodoxin
MSVIALYLSSVTGNTRQVADAIREALSPAYTVVICDSRAPVAHPEADLCLLCFWCRRATLDPNSQKVLHLYRRQPFLAVGTMGGRPESAHGERVRENVRRAVDADNRCRGIFLCRGKIPEARTEYRRALPKDHRLYLDDAGYARQLSSRSHPDAADLAHAVAFVRNALRRLGL